MATELLILFSSLSTAAVSAFLLFRGREGKSAEPGGSTFRGNIVLSFGFGISLSLLSGRWAPLLTLPALVWLSTSLLSRMTRKRFISRIDREIPFLALSMGLLVEGGSSVSSAMENLISHYPDSPSRHLLISLRNALHLGGGRELPGKDSFYGSEKGALLFEIVSSSSFLGSGPSENLANLARELMSERALKAEERALKAPVKLMVPLCIFLFPALFLLIFSPLILRLGEMIP